MVCDDSDGGEETGSRAGLSRQLQRKKSCYLRRELLPQPPAVSSRQPLISGAASLRPGPRGNYQRVAGGDEWRETGQKESLSVRRQSEVDEEKRLRRRRGKAKVEAVVRPEPPAGCSGTCDSLSSRVSNLGFFGLSQSGPVDLTFVSASNSVSIHPAAPSCCFVPRHTWLASGLTLHSNNFVEAFC